jgi:flagellar basal body-associated protein FliL
VIYLAVVIGILLISVVLAPFWFGAGGLLQASAQVNSKETLVALKDALIKRYVEEEKAFKAGNLSQLAWNKRKVFLTHRYVDAARRLDFLEHTT